MTRAIFEFDAQKTPTAFWIDGHAGYDDAGSDIVCSAISALTQAALLGLCDVMALPAAYRVERGSMECRLPENLQQPQRYAAQVLLTTLHRSLLEIASQYPDCLRVQERKTKQHDEI